MAASQKDRVRASKLRKRRSEGKALNEADRIWLADYEKQNGTGRAAKPSTPTTPTKKGPVVSGPQLAVPGTEHVNGSHVHETVPETEAFSSTETTWIPTVPPEAEGTAPPPDGAPPPPKAGTPLVGDDTATPTGDPAAAQQFAAFVKFFTMLGMRAGREMLDDLDVPPEVRALLASEDLTGGTLDTVGAAAERVAMKYGFRSVPMADEAIVLAALGGSAALVVKNMQRKKLAPSTKKPDEPKVPEHEPTVLDHLWREGRSS